MGQRVTKVTPITHGEVYDQHSSTPPKPRANRAVEHPHPRDETPVGAGGGGGEERKEAWKDEEKRKRKKWWQRLRSFFRAAKKQQKSSSGQGEVEEQQQQQQPDEGEKRKVAWAGKSSDDYIFSRYSVGDQLGKGGFGVVHEGTRLADGLKVAVKYVTKTENMECIFIPDHPAPLPKEIALTILANKGHRVRQIIQLLDWTDHPDHFALVLECPSPCENLVEFVRSHGGSLNEDTARQIMWQVAYAANMCCLRGVLHRDVKLDNLLINRETYEVKLIDFGSGDILRRSPYRSYFGTALYAPPEFYTRGKYCGRPATVWSLGIVMFALLCGHFPGDFDLFLLQYKTWCKPGLSKECNHLLRALLTEEPSQRLGLGQILSHNWFKTTPVGISHAALRLAGCSGRRFHPSSRLCVLRGEQAMCSVLRLGLWKQC
ncbi:serine/threonine-protein kinase pim-1-like [Garra rufa]|uniref:serine/threonine-protein kinase pim-1-like n=1 Tax=Garra rufa TaxID=137080 RepID=UPI003CCE5DBC